MVKHFHHPKVESLSPYTSVDTGMEKIEETQVNFFACCVSTVVKHLPHHPRVESLSQYISVDTGMEKIEETQVNFFACCVGTVVKQLPRHQKV
jgi:hypothetical protein